MSDKITITTEKDGRTFVFEGSGTLTLTERVREGLPRLAHPTSTSREERGVEIEWDGGYTIREADRQPDTLEELKAARKELADLRKENDRLEQVLQDPLLLKGLEAAWEAAEQAPECRKGDVLIEHFGPDAYHVYLAEGNYSRLPCAIRILSSAPKREPWQDLADAMPSNWNEEAREYAARMLYENGVRMAGGGES